MSKKANPTASKKPKSTAPKAKKTHYNDRSNMTTSDLMRGGKPRSAVPQSKAKKK